MKLTNKITSVIVDDEVPGRVVLKSLLSQFCPEVIILGEAGSAEDAYDLINLLQPDVIFLDIQMPRESGFDLLQRFEKISFDVIFVTSHDKYAISAIKFSALDYLLKPVDLDDLKDCVKKAIQRKADLQRAEPLIINLIHNVSKDSEENKKLAIHSPNKVKFIPLDEITRCEADDNYTRVFTINREMHILSKTLKDFENFLPASSKFVRINRRVIINANQIEQYSKGDSCVVYLKDNSFFKITRKKKSEINEKLR